MSDLFMASTVSIFQEHRSSRSSSWSPSILHHQPHPPFLLCGFCYGVLSFIGREAYPQAFVQSDPPSPSCRGAADRKRLTQQGAALHISLPDALK